MLRPWRSVLREALLTLHGHQLNGLTEVAWAMVQAGHCQLSKMAVMTPGSATMPSRERRWQRLVANERLDADAALDDWARWALREVSAVPLFLDETPQRNHLRCMKVSRMVGGRAVALIWRCHCCGVPPPSSVNVDINMQLKLEVMAKLLSFEPSGISRQYAFLAFSA